jgi:DME family drug/metabolite transporter
VVLAGVLWGTGGLVVTVLHEDDRLSAMTASAWRMLIAAAALLVFCQLVRRTLPLASLTHRRRWVLATGAGTAAGSAPTSVDT